jgi:hypothetical protein
MFVVTTSFPWVIIIVTIKDELYIFLIFQVVQDRDSNQALMELLTDAALLLFYNRDRNNNIHVENITIMKKYRKLIISTANTIKRHCVRCSAHVLTKKERLTVNLHKFKTQFDFVYMQIWWQLTINQSMEVVATESEKESVVSVNEFLINCIKKCLGINCGWSPWLFVVCILFLCTGTSTGNGKSQTIWMFVSPLYLFYFIYLFISIYFLSFIFLSFFLFFITT